MTARKPTILLSEGSSLSSREAITALGLAGHRVELMSSDPFFVKAAFGTASTGVWCVSDERQRDALLQSFEQSNAFAEGLVVQAAISGALERTQAVFDRGRLVACHIYRQIAEGPGGGDLLKLSVVRPEVRKTVMRIGQALKWHGALSFDYIHDDATAKSYFIDANPRLVEPMNAWLAGVDLPGSL